MTQHPRVRFHAIATLAVMAFAAVSTPAHAQNSAHPDAKPALAENPYIRFTDPWRWDIRAQLFLSPANIIGDDPYTPRRGVNERVYTGFWQPREIELVYPVVREGSFYWSPNREVEVDIRFDDVPIRQLNYNDLPDRPFVVRDAPVEQKFVRGTYSEYSVWASGDIIGKYRQLHMEHTSHIVTADTIFNDDLARQLPWPEQWAPEFAAYLTPVVETVGEPIPADAEETIETLVKFWIGEDTDPKSGPQLDVVKFLTGKVVEYFTERGQSTEFTQRTTGGGRASFVVTSNTWGGFLVRPAHVVAKQPQGSRLDQATLLTAVLRSIGVPARTVICVNELEDDPLRNTVGLVEFAMHDPERDLTFWVPIDVDRVRLTGGRSSQFKRKWIYFGTHDELSHMIPIANFFHPPADYRAFDLPLLYGIRSMSDKGELPGYMIQSLLVDPIVTPATGNDRRRNEEE